MPLGSISLNEDINPILLGFNFSRPAWVSLTAFDPTLVYCTQKHTNGVCLLWQPVSVVQRSRQLSMPAPFIITQMQPVLSQMSIRTWEPG